MKNIFSVAILACAWAGATLSLNAADQPSLNENLKPLKMFLGNWSIRWTENGQPMAGKATVKADAGGNIVTLKTEALDKDGKSAVSYMAVFFWQSETKSLAEVHFLPDGSHGS